MESKDQYWCHTCVKKIKPRGDKKPEIICSECNGDFVEIMEQENNSQQNNINNNQQQNNNSNQPNNNQQNNLRNIFGIPINNIQVIDLGQNNMNLGHNPMNGIQQFLQLLANRQNQGNFFKY